MKITHMVSRWQSTQTSETHVKGTSGGQHGPGKGYIVVTWHKTSASATNGLESTITANQNKATGSCSCPEWHAMICNLRHTNLHLCDAARLQEHSQQAVVLGKIWKSQGNTEMHAVRWRTYVASYKTITVFLSVHLLDFVLSHMSHTGNVLCVYTIVQIYN